MPLSAGARLGPYEIVSAIGAGGMGEVYKARDTRLDRTVAIKVLPEHVASDPDLKQRFEREAKTISSLNHPHICTLHDIGSQDGIDFLVMEYLEGDTLAQRLEQGALPLDRALKVAIEIADALDKAHRQGITHRDLKPGNIMLTKEGAKLLDFRLAKFKPGHDAPVGVSAPTVSAGRPAKGAILGTLQYMAPEQLEGKEADHRTDIFAFGAVAYEMVTGQRAFEGESQASLIHAIMGADPPPMSSLQTLSPPGLDYVVKTCLAKTPDGRWQDAGDVNRDLTWMTVRGSDVEPPAAGVTVPGTSRRRRMGLVRLTRSCQGRTSWFPLTGPQMGPSWCSGRCVPRPIETLASSR
jgi:serine/threonine protein kinase